MAERVGSRRRQQSERNQPGTGSESPVKKTTTTTRKRALTEVRLNTLTLAFSENSLAWDNGYRSAYLCAFVDEHHSVFGR